MAPEVISGEDSRGKSLDWWSMGVILFELLVGIPPFNDNTIEKIFDNIKEMRIDWPIVGNEDEGISYEAADLIRKLLEPDVKKRFGTKNGAEDLKSHPFFKGFDWKNIKNMKPPIVPKKMKLSENFSLLDLEVVFKRKQKMVWVKEMCPLDEFRMKRVDLLYEKNQEQLKLLKSPHLFKKPE